MTTEEAVLRLQSDPSAALLVAGSYLDADAAAAAVRFADSEEFAETVRRIRDLGAGVRVVDLGAGTGIASLAFAGAGFSVIAVEPDLSGVVGMGRFVETDVDRSVAKVAAFGSELPLADASVDVVYCRQVLHHLMDLPASLAECSRVLRPGGLFVAVREHVVDDDDQLEAFQAEHPVHRLAGGEHAWSLPAYLSAITGAGLMIVEELGPWDSIINAFPEVRRPEDLGRAPEIVMGERFGTLGAAVGRLPIARDLVWRRLRRSRPGRLYSFVAQRPAAEPTH